MARMLPFPEIPRLYLISWCLFFARLLEVGWKCILLFHVSVVELNFSPLKQMKMRTDLAWKWYSGSRSIPSDCLSGHLLRKWSVKKAKTDKIQEWASAAEDGVCEKTSKQAGCSALKNSPGPEWRKSLSTTYRQPRASHAAVDSREHVSKGFTSQPTVPPNHLITLPLQW